MTPLESFCSQCPHIGDCDISGSEKAMKCVYVVRANKPTDRTLFELYSLKQWGEKYGWDAVEGLLDVRIGVYEKQERKLR